MERLAQLIGSHALSVLFFAALGLLVVITSLLGKPKRRATTTEFPAPLGAKLIACASLGVWIFLLLGPIAVGMYWLAAIFALGPAYTIWRWPGSISIDELQICQHVWCRPRVSIRWKEIAAISESRDTVVLTGQGGERIKISTLQVGVDELFAEIRRHTEVRQL